MPRNISSAMLTQITNQAMSPAIFAVIPWAGATEYIWSGVGQIVVDIPVTTTTTTTTTSIIQVAGNTETSTVPTCAAAFTSANQPGNSIIAIAIDINVFGANGVADSRGNLYTQVYAPNGYYQVWVASGIVSGTNTVTCTSGGGFVKNLIVLEVHGLATTGVFDVGSCDFTNESPGVPLSTGSITTTVAGDLLLVAGIATSTASSIGGRPLLLTVPGTGSNDGEMLLLGQSSVAQGSYLDGIESTVPSIIWSGILAFKAATMPITSTTTVLAPMVFTGVGQFGKISAIQEVSGVQAPAVSLVLSGVDPTTLADALGGINQGNLAQIYLGAVVSGAVVASPVLLYQGLTDQVTVDVGPETATITLSLESRLSDLQRPMPQKYTAQYQMQLWPNDVCLMAVEKIIDCQIFWH
jgi:hypothetical protein